MAAGTVEDASDEFTIRVSTGARMLTLDFSRAPVRMSVRGDSMLPVDKHNFLRSTLFQRRSMVIFGMDRLTCSSGNP